MLQNRRGCWYQIPGQTSHEILSSHSQSEVRHLPDTLAGSKRGKRVLNENDVVKYRIFTRPSRFWIEGQPKVRFSLKNIINENNFHGESYDITELQQRLLDSIILRA